MQPTSYDDAYKEVSEILAEIEQGDIPLESLPEKVKRAGVLIKYCQDRLRAISDELDDLSEEE